MLRDNERESARKRAIIEGKNGLRALLKSGKVILIKRSNWSRVVCDRIIIKRCSEYRSN